MIIFGWGTRYSTKAKGSFHCPVCGRSSLYKHKVMKNWATLYFIPIFPVNTVGECVDCEGCGSRFNADVLTHNHEYQKQAEVDETKRSLKAAVFVVVKNITVKIALMDGDITNSELRCIAEVLSSIIKREITVNQVNRFVTEAYQKDVSISRYASQIRGHIKNLEKEKILKAAIKVAGVNGIISEEKRVVLYKLADDLKLPLEYINDAFEEADIAA